MGGGLRRPAAADPVAERAPVVEALDVEKGGGRAGDEAPPARARALGLHARLEGMVEVPHALGVVDGGMDQGRELGAGLGVQFPGAGQVLALDGERVLPLGQRAHAQRHPQHEPQLPFGLEEHPEVGLAGDQLQDLPVGGAHFEPRDLFAQGAEAMREHAAAAGLHPAAHRRVPARGIAAEGLAPLGEEGGEVGPAHASVHGDRVGLRGADRLQEARIQDEAAVGGYALAEGGRAPCARHDGRAAGVRLAHRVDRLLFGPRLDDGGRRRREHPSQRGRDVALVAAVKPEQALVGRWRCLHVAEGYQFFVATPKHIFSMILMTKAALNRIARPDYGRFAPCPILIS